MWLHVVELGAVVLMYVVRVPLLKAPTFPPSEDGAPPADIPTCKQTSEVRP